MPFCEDQNIQNPLPPSVSKVLLVKEKEEIFWELQDWSAALVQLWQKRFVKQFCFKIHRSADYVIGFSHCDVISFTDYYMYQRGGWVLYVKSETSFLWWRRETQRKILLIYITLIGTLRSLIVDNFVLLNCKFILQRRKVLNITKNMYESMYMQCNGEYHHITKF
jgi:hypothetical protein